MAYNFIKHDSSKVFTYYKHRLKDGKRIKVTIKPLEMVSQFDHEKPSIHLRFCGGKRGVKLTQEILDSQQRSCCRSI